MVRLGCATDLYVHMQAVHAVFDLDCVVQRRQLIKMAFVLIPWAASKPAGLVPAPRGTAGQDVCQALKPGAGMAILLCLLPIDDINHCERLQCEAMTTS